MSEQNERDTERCWACHGSGEDGERDDYGDWRYRSKCVVCDGTGHILRRVEPVARRDT